MPVGLLSSFFYLTELWEYKLINFAIKSVQRCALTLTYLGGGGPLWPPCRFFNGASIPLKILRSSFMTFPLVSPAHFDTKLPRGTYGTTFMVQ